MYNLCSPGWASTFIWARDSEKISVMLEPLANRFHAAFLRGGGGRYSRNCKIFGTKANLIKRYKERSPIGHSSIWVNFDLKIKNKFRDNSLKEHLKLVILQSLVTNCCKMLNV